MVNRWLTPRRGKALMVTGYCDGPNMLFNRARLNESTVNIGTVKFKNAAKGRAITFSSCSSPHRRDTPTGRYMASRGSIQPYTVPIRAAAMADRSQHLIVSAGVLYSDRKTAFVAPATYHKVILAFRVISSHRLRIPSWLKNNVALRTEGSISINMYSTCI